MPKIFIKYNLENHEMGVIFQFLIFFLTVCFKKINITLKNRNRNQMLKVHLICLLVFFLFLQYAVYHWFFQNIKFKEGEMKGFIHKNMYKTKLKSTFTICQKLLGTHPFSAEALPFELSCKQKATSLWRAWRDPFIINIQLQVQFTRIWQIISVNEKIVLCLCILWK